jgi:hypothetical protein
VRPLLLVAGLLVGAALAAGCNQPTPEAAAFEALRRLDGCVDDRDLAGARRSAVRAVRLDPASCERAAGLLQAVEVRAGDTARARCTDATCWLHVPGARRPLARDGRFALWPCRVTLNFPETPLGEAIEFVASSTGLAIELDPRVDPAQTTVSLRLKDIPFDDALKLVAEQCRLEPALFGDRLLLLPREQKESELSELRPPGP